MSEQNNDITLKVLLEHVQGIRNGMQDMEARLTKRMDTLENKVDRNHLQTMTVLTNLDHRIDDIEIHQIPKIKRHIQMR